MRAHTKIPHEFTEFGDDIAPTEKHGQLSNVIAFIVWTSQIIRSRWPCRYQSDISYNGPARLLW